MLAVNYEAKGQRPPFFNTSKLQVSSVTAPLKHIIAETKHVFLSFIVTAAMLVKMLCWALPFTDKRFLSDFL